MLLIAVQVIRTVEARNTAVQPTVRPFHRSRSVTAVSRSRAALVKSHHDICTYLALDIHHQFRREHQLAAIYMRREPHAFLRHLTDVRERKDLIAT